MEIRVKKIIDSIDLKYQTSGASGFDCISTVTIDLEPLQRVKIPLGFSIELPSGYEGQVRSRSGLSLNEGLVVIPGTIDSDYRGEVCAVVVNFDTQKRTIVRTQRIAQFVIAPIIKADFEFVEELDNTQRGTCGFGSTGK